MRAKSRKQLVFRYYSLFSIRRNGIRLQTFRSQRTVLAVEAFCQSNVFLKWMHQQMFLAKESLVKNGETGVHGSTISSSRLMTQRANYPLS